LRGVIHFTLPNIIPHRDVNPQGDALVWNYISGPDLSNFLLQVHERAPPPASISLLWSNYWFASLSFTFQ
jgi:hypothetical protein